MVPGGREADGQPITRAQGAVRQTRGQDRGVQGAGGDDSQSEPKLDLSRKNSQPGADDLDPERGFRRCSTQDIVADISLTDQQGLAGQILNVDAIRPRKRVRPGQDDVERLTPELRDVEPGHSHAAGQNGEIEPAIRDSGEVRLRFSGDQLDLHLGVSVPKPGEQCIQVSGALLLRLH